MEDIQQFVIVEFSQTKEVGTILNTWLVDKNECYWPDRNPRSALVKGIGPDKTNWEKWDIRILDSCDNVQVAILKEKKAQLTSDLATTDGEMSCNNNKKKKRPSKKPQRLIYSSDSESTDEDLPDFKNVNNDKNISKRKKTVEDTLASKLPATPRSSSMKQNFAATPPVIHQDQIELESPASSFRSNGDITIHQRMKKMEGQLNAIERTVLQNKVDISTILELLQTQHQGGETIQVTLPNEFERRFPMKELDDVLELENTLSNNEDKVKELTNYLRSIGGSSVEDCTRRILVRLFTNEVARHFSWEGRGGKKRSLQNSSLVQLIGRVVQHKHPVSFDMKTFEKKTSEWFRQSGTRIYVKNKTSVIQN